MEGVRTPAGVLWNGTVAPALCLDLDGTVRHSKSGEFISGPEDVALYPGVEAKIWEYRDNDFLIFGISNQGGVACGYKSPTEVMAELAATVALFERNPFHSIRQCFHLETGTVFPYNKRSLLRKPDIGMLAMMEEEAFNAGFVVDWDNSLFVGDRAEDRQCAENARIKFVPAHLFFDRKA
jgi:D-glycero-D-manno-heptose 1,7-bisphosphate phosphatase